MAILSRLVNVAKVSVNPVRYGGGGIGGKIENRPSRWQWDIFKDQLHLYIMIGAIPLGLVVLLSNIFVGQSRLEPIPEGYVPKEHEYFKSPISRWMMKNIFSGYQENYEIFLGKIWEEEKKRCMFELMREVKRQQKLHQDYKGWYTKLHSAEYLRMAINSKKQYIDSSGFPTGNFAKQD